MPSVTYLDSARIRFRQELHLRRRHIDCHRFLLIDSGNGEFQFSELTHEVHAGMLLLLSPGERESHYRGEEEVSYLYVEFDSATQLIDTPCRQFSSTFAHFKTMCALLDSIHREHGRGAEALLLAAVKLAGLYSEHAPGREGIDPRVGEALKFIDHNIDRPIRVPELASRVGLSVPHFRRLFHQAVNASPKEYLIRERMLHARKILQTEGLRVGEVADVLHFENVFQFSNQYKKVHGHSPVQDRR